MFARNVLIALTLILCGCCAHHEKQEAAHFDTAFLFEKDGCLKEDIKEGYKEDIPCLDKNKDGCITRAEWDDFMGYWSTHVPEAGVSLCKQKLAAQKQ